MFNLLTKILATLIYLLCIIHPLVAAPLTPVREKLGYIGPLTGSAAILGVDALTSLRLAIKEQGADHKIELHVEDDQYQTSKAIGAYEYLVRAKGVKTLFMLTYGAIFALAERAQKDGVIIINTLDCDEAIAALPGNMFCIAKLTEQMGATLGKAAVDLNAATSVGMIVYENDPFMEVVAKEAAKQLPSENKIDMAYYKSGTADFRSDLTRFKSNGVTAIFF